MAQSFTATQWTKIHDLFDERAEDFGLPRRRQKSVVLASFNIRKLGSTKKKSAGAWEFFKKVIERFDLAAIQEVQDDLSGLIDIKDHFGGQYGMAVSDITGSYPGGSPPPERLAFLYRWRRVERTEIASDITYDRSSIVNTLYESRADFAATFDEHTSDLRKWKRKKAERKKQGKKAPAKPVIELPEFVSFVRQPHCVSFRIPSKNGGKPLEFLAVNAHLLFGKNKSERYWEFLALTRWLVDRARNRKRMYHDNMILLGDLNFDFDNPKADRARTDADLKGLNKRKLRAKSHATLNFPFLSVHPKGDKVFRTNARMSQTYDQVGLVINDRRLPDPEKNKKAGSKPDGFDYGVFNFVELFSEALHGRSFDQLTKKDKTALFKKFEHDVTDHMPIWVRLPVP